MAALQMFCIKKMLIKKQTSVLHLLTCNYTWRFIAGQSSVFHQQSIFIKMHKYYANHKRTAGRHICQAYLSR